MSDPPTRAARLQPPVRREMGISHADLFRCLPQALGGLPHDVHPGVIRVRHPAGQVEIRYAEESERRIASMRIPLTRVEIHYLGLSPEQAGVFLRLFDRAYQKGGG